MNKRGFTLIEIIICIGIIVFIGTISFFGIRLVNKNIKENKLEHIEDKIMLAAETYIETHKDVKTKVNDQGVIIPLNVLHNEGLINLDGIIDKNDDDYVMALLAGGSPGEECESTYIEGSWKIGSKTIYICTKNTGGSGGSNLAIINPDSISNLNKVEREIYYFKGFGANNYAKFKKNNSTYMDLRILSVDTDDSITVVNKRNTEYVNRKYQCKDDSNWNNYFEQTMSFTPIGGEKNKKYVEIRNSYFKSSSSFSIDYSIEEGDNPMCGGNYLPSYMVFKTFDQGIEAGETTIRFAGGNDMKTEYPYDSWLFNDGNISTNQYSGQSGYLKEKKIVNEYLHLKPCIKITSGTGASDNPYILERKGTC